MEKIGAFKAFILGLMLCCFALLGLTGCGDPREGMEITLTGADDTTITQTEDGKMNVSITMGYDAQSNLTQQTQAKIVARVEGGNDSVSRRVDVVSSDATKIMCVENTFDNNLKTTTIVLQALCPTYDDNNIYIDFVCAETSDISKRVYVKIDLPAVGVSAKGGTGVSGDAGVMYYGVAAASNVSLDPYQLFSFTPAIATVPDLTYTVNGRSYDNLSSIQIPERDEISEGFLGLSVHSTSDPDNAEMQATVYLRVYENIDLESVYMTREDLLSTHGTPINQLELIKNQTVVGANEAVAQINYESSGVDDLKFDFNVSNGVLNNILAISQSDEHLNQFIVRGATLCTDGVDIEFSISFAGISNSPVYKTNLKVFVVDYPKSVLINGQSGSNLYVANVYDSYSGTARGTPVQISLTQFSVEKGKYRIEVVTNGGESYLTNEDVLNAVQIRIQGQNANYYLSDWDNEEGLEFESGQILLFTLTDSNVIGRVLLRIVSVAIDENDLFETALTRNFVLSLGKGVTDITLSTTAVDQNTHFVYLQIDQYNAHGNYMSKTINYDVAPVLANKLDMTVASSNENVFIAEEVTSSGSFIIRAVAPGVAKIIMTAGSGYRETFDVQVLNVLGGLATDINVAEQSDIVAESSFNTIKMNENSEIETRTIQSLTVAQGKPVFINLNCYPANADLVTVTATSDDTTVVSVLKANFTQLILNTNNAGTASITVSVVYDHLNPAGNALEGYGGEKSHRDISFEVVVYAPIISFEVSHNFAQMYIAGTTSVYDAEKCELTINAIVNPQYSTVKASATKWTLLGTNINQTWVLLNGERKTQATGASLRVNTVTEVSGNASSVTVYIIASIEDKNQTKTQKITLEIKNIVAIQSLKAVEYDASSGGYYFEESKGFSNPGDEIIPQSQVVKTVLSATNGETPTNPNLEYFLFDATKTTQGGIINYTATIDATKIENQLANKYCDTAYLIFDTTENKYRIAPRKAGYAILYVVPQSIMTFYAEDVRDANSFEAMLATSSTSDKILKLIVTVANGIDEPYRIYTVEDFVAIGTPGGLNKNYELRNSIDFSTYFTNLYNNEQKWTPIGTQETPFSGTIKPRAGQGENGTQSLVLSGFVLREDTTPQISGDDAFGLFGVIADEAKIEGITFDFALVRYENNQTEMQTTYYGVLAGKCSGTICDVKVYVANMQIVGNSSRMMYAGLLGYGDMQKITNEDCCLKNVSVSYNNVLIDGENNLAVSFGGLVGHNVKNINDGKADSKSTVYMNLEVVNMGRTENLIGGAVARNGLTTGTANSYTVQHITTTGTINGIYAFAAGGICGTNNGLIENCSSSMQIWDANNIGGVVGYSQTKQMLKDCSYHAYETANGKPNLYRSTNSSAETAIGGLVGRMSANIGNAGTAECSYVKSFAGTDFVNISATGTMAYLGGLYGTIVNNGLGSATSEKDITLLNCFSDVNIFVDAGNEVVSANAGGLVGYVANAAANQFKIAIQTCYTLGTYNSSGSRLGLLVGNAPSGANGVVILPYDVYTGAVATENGTPTHRLVVGGIVDLGLAAANDFYVFVRADTEPTVKNSISNSEDEVYIMYLPLEQIQYNGMDGTTYRLSETSWNFLEVGDATNSGLPLIKLTGESVLYPIIPTSFDCAQPYQTFEFDVFNTEATQGAVITDLFEINIGPTNVGLDKSNTEVSIESSNPNVISIVPGVYLKDFSVVVHNVGTAVLTITSTQNKNVKLKVQLCSVAYTDEFYLFKSENDAYDEEDGVYFADETKAFALNADNAFEIKLGQSLEMFVRYYANGHILSGLNGGLMIYTQSPNTLKFAGVDFVESVERPGYYVAIIENSSLVSVETLQTESNAKFYFYVYKTGSFTNLDTNQPLLTREIVLPTLEELALTISVVNGASEMQVTRGGTEEQPNTVEAKDSFTFNVILETDSENDKTTGANAVVEIYDEQSGEWIKVYDLTLNTAGDFYDISGDVETFIKQWQRDYKNIEITDTPIAWNEQINIEFNSSTVSRTATGFVQSFEFYLLDDFVHALKKTLRFRAHFSSFFTSRTDFPNTGPVVYTEADVYWNVLPQGVDNLSLTHFSDAESSGNYLINAGQRPTNTIVAGEYGLLSIQISPDYAVYDTVIVTSSVSNNDSISFDQRVLIDTQENLDGTTTTKYAAYEMEVHKVDGGISLAKVSSYDEGTKKYAFDGNLWVRTIVSNTLPLGTEFVITVTVLRDGQQVKQGTLNVVVDKVIDINLDFYSYHETLGAFVAAGTGGSNPTSRYDDNNTAYTTEYDKNELKITTLGTVNSLSVSVFDDNGAGATIERRNERYYVVLPKTNIEAQINRQFYVQASATKNINGMKRTVTKTMKFTVVNFVLAENLNVKNAVNGNYVAVYIPGGKYDLYVEEDYKKFSYNESYKGDVELFFNAINAKNATINQNHNPWQYINTTEQTIKTMPYYIAAIDGPAVPGEKIINGNYYVEWIYQDTTESSAFVYETGYKIVPKKYGQTETLIFDLTYTYSQGRFAYTSEPVIGFERMTTVVLNFVQRSSIDNPIPIYTNAEFLGMEAGKHYILMRDLNFAGVGTYWKPFATAIASLNGNGKTITIGQFDVTSNTKYGFFETISAATVVKNLNVCYAAVSAIGIDVSELSGFTFGAFAAENNGIINNCSITRGTSSGIYPVFKIENNGGLTNTNEQSIAGFVAVNDGDISNSRVENFSITVSWGHLSGFCVTNTGTIASSYFAGMSREPSAVERMAGTLRNNGILPLIDFITTTGFVTFNEGVISGSYVGGAFTQIDEHGNTQYIKERQDENAFASDAPKRDARIYCSYYASGFVFENAGTVYDSYSGVYINCGNDACGFVYRNQSSGFVTRCYSVSLLPPSSNSQTPFIGTTQMGTNIIKVNNNNTRANAFENCYFYDFGCPDVVIRNEVATALSIAQFINQDGAELSAWQNYSVSRMSGLNDGQEFTGVWTFVQTGNEYFNPDVFTKNFGPQLVSANVIARGDPTATGDNKNLMQSLDVDRTSYDEETGETIYRYIYNVPNDVKVVRDNTTNKTYTVFEPFVITNAVDLNKVLVNDTETQSNKNWFRLACDIDLSEVREGTDGTLNTISTNFAGNFEGNMHTISKIEIVSESQSQSYNEEIIQSANAGLVAKIYSFGNSLGTFKNLNLDLNDISATLVINVGTLAGTADCAYLYNIDVSGSDAIVIGRNNVGGLVGKLKGTSRVNNISSSVSARAVFGAPNQATDANIKKGVIYNEDLWRMFVYEDVTGQKRYSTYDELVTKDQYLAYIGGLFGIIDVEPFEGPDTMDSFNLNSSLVSNLRATGVSNVIGGTVGGVAGFVGSSSVVNLASKEVERDAYLNASVYAGGLVGENHGYIRYSEVKYIDSIQTQVNASNIGEYKSVADTNFFRGSSVAIGGLVGFNYGLTLEGIQTGNVYCSNSRINVVNRSASIAGGAIGVSIGGSFTAVLTTGAVRAALNSYIGGMFGAVVNLGTAITSIEGPAALISDTFLVDPYATTLNNAAVTKFNTEIKPVLEEQPALTTYSVAINNWAAKDYDYFHDVALQVGGLSYIGGFAGYVSADGDALTIIHSSREPLPGELDRIEPDRIEFSSETNFYVNKIYDREIAKTNVEANNSPISLAAGTRTMTLAAVGSEVTYVDELSDGNVTYVEGSTPVDYAKGLNRNYMQSENGQIRMYGNWARYSFSRDENGNFAYDEYGSVQFDRTTVPDLIEIASVGDIRSVMAWELNANYVLVNDINCENESFVLGQLDSPFTGKLDGNGFKVYNYNLKGTNALAVGFFAYTKGAEIKNLKLFNFNIKAYSSITSDSQIGFLVGKAIDTTIDNVEILNKFNEDDVEEVVSSIETNYMYVGALAGYVFTDDPTILSSYTRTFAFADINVLASNKRQMAVGGLFGLVEGSVLENEALKQDVSDFYPDGAVNQKQANTVFMENNGFVGNICVESSSNGLRLGGIAGAIINTTMAQNFAHANIEGKNITDANNTDGANNSAKRYGLFAGAYAGYIDASFVAKAVASGELYISVGFGMTDLTQPINIGGLAGYVDATVWTASVSPNISFVSQHTWNLSADTQNSVLDYSSEPGQVNTRQNIGGFAGAWRVDQNYQYYNILSTTTIFNATTLSRVDSWAFASDQSVGSTEQMPYLIADTFVSNVSSNNFEAQGVRMVETKDILLGQQSTDGFGLLLSITSGAQSRPSFNNSKIEGMYPAVSMVGKSTGIDTTTLTGTKFEQVYSELYQAGTRLEDGSKLKPELLRTQEDISTAVKESANGEYKFYFCMADWQRSLIYLDSSTYVGPYGQEYYEENVNTNYDFYGFFNASDIKIKQTTSYDYLFGNPERYAVYAKTPKFGVFDDILDNSRNPSAKALPYGSVVSGVTMLGATLSYTSSATTDVNIGLIACGEVGRSSYIYGCTTSGIIEYTYNSSGRTVNIGGIAANCDGQINSCSSSVDIISTGSATFNVGGLVANMKSVNQTQGITDDAPIYGLTNCYFNGSIINNAGNAKVGGVVANVSGSLSSDNYANGVLFARNVYTIGAITNNGGVNVAYNTFVADKEVFSGGAYTLDSGNNTKLATVSGRLFYESTTVDSSKHTGEILGITPFVTLAHRAEGGRNYEMYREISTRPSTHETSGSLATRLGVGVWASFDKYNYVYPVLAYTQAINEEKGVLESTGTGTETDPYILKNEGLLVWALKNNKAGSFYQIGANFEYTKINDLIALLNTGLDASEQLRLSDFTFKGNLDGRGHSITGSTGVLVGAIESTGSVSSIKFTNINGTNQAVLATTNSGLVVDCYLDNTQNSNCLVTTNNGEIKDSFTLGAGFNKSGSGTLNRCYNATALADMDTYAECMGNNQGMDFYRIWAFIPDNASAVETQDNITGHVTLRSFIENWSTADLSAESFPEYQINDVTLTTENAVTTIDGIEIKSIKSLVRIDQYLKRNSAISFVLKATFTENINLNFEGKRLDPIGGVSRLNSNTEFVINGNGATLYNIYFDDLTTRGVAGLFARLGVKSSVRDLTLNNVTVSSEEYAGAVAVTSLSNAIENVTVSNSWIVCNSNVAGAIVAHNNGGKLEHCIVDNCYIDGLGNTTGGMIGLNTGGAHANINNSFGNDSAGLHNIVQNTAVNSFAALRKNVNMTEVGGMIGASRLLNAGADSYANSVVGVDIINTTVHGFSNTGGIIGYSEAKITNSSLSHNLTAVTAFEVGTQKPENVGGIVGLLDGTGAVSKATLDAPELFGVTFSASLRADPASNVGGIIGKMIASSIRTSEIQTGSSVYGRTSVGGIVGYAVKSRIGGASNTVVSTKINLNATANYVGGIVGQIAEPQESDTDLINAEMETIVDYATVEACVFTSANSSYVGGIAGSISDATASIKCAIVTNDTERFTTINGVNFVGGAVGCGYGKIEGYQQESAIAKVEYTTIQASGDYVGGLVGDSHMDKIANATLKNVNILASKSAVQYVGGVFGNVLPNDKDVIISSVGITGSQSETNSVTANEGASTFIGGFAGRIGNSNMEYDIDVSLPSLRYMTVATNSQSEYVGGYIGANYATSFKGKETIISADSSNNDGTDVAVSGGKCYTGGIVGFNSSNSLVSLGVFKVAVNYIGTRTDRNKIGGFAGQNDGAISKASIVNTDQGTISGNSYIGGFVGLNNGTIASGYASNININASTLAGGFAGQNTANATISGSEFSGGNITYFTDGTTLSGKIGGFVGLNQGQITNGKTSITNLNYNVGGVSHNGALTDIGGFVGYNAQNATITTAKAAFTGIYGYENVGGIAGYNAGTITAENQQGTSQGTVYAQGVAGGLVGYNTGSIENYTASVTMLGRFCDEDKNFSSKSAIAVFENGKEGSTYVMGGAIGYNAKDGTVDQCSAGGTINGGGLLGGFVGVNAGIIQKASLTQSITFTVYACSFFDATFIGYGSNPSLTSFTSDLTQHTSENYVPGWLRIDYSMQSENRNSIYNIFYSGYVGNESGATAVLNKYSNTVFMHDSTIMLHNSTSMSQYAGFACLPIGVGIYVGIQCNPNSSATGSTYINANSKFTYTDDSVTLGGSSGLDTQGTYYASSTGGFWVHASNAELPPNVSQNAYLAGNDDGFNSINTPWTRGCVYKVSA